MANWWLISRYHLLLSKIQKTPTNKCHERTSRAVEGPTCRDYLSPNFVTNSVTSSIFRLRSLWSLVELKLDVTIITQRALLIRSAQTPLLSETKLSAVINEFSSVVSNSFGDTYGVGARTGINIIIDIRKVNLLFTRVLWSLLCVSNLLFYNLDLAFRIIQ